MTDAFVCDGVRTPFGRYGGALAGVRADDLAAVPLRALHARNPRLDLDAVEEVVLGCANQAGEDNRNVARMAALLAGFPESVPGVTVNRLCGSGMEAVVQAARAIRAGEADLVIAGGIESMTRAPWVLSKSEVAFGRRLELEDSTLGWRFVNPRMREQYGTDSMPETAENVAAQFGISREDQDAFALRSQLRCAAAQARGVPKEELVPVRIDGPRGEALWITQDEHPRPSATLDRLHALAPIVRVDGTVTAGNSSGINDGAAALIVASEAAAVRHGLTPLARIVQSASAGVAPRIMGIGPVPATRRALSACGLAVTQMSVIELNEAFAAQALAALRELGVPDDAPHVNPNGGAIALGHPLGASGARLVLTSAYALRRTRGRYALCSMCVGVGQGITVILESV